DSSSSSAPIWGGGLPSRSLSYRSTGVSAHSCLWPDSGICMVSGYQGTKGRAFGKIKSRAAPATAERTTEADNVGRERKQLRYIARSKRTGETDHQATALCVDHKARDLAAIEMRP